MGLDIHAHEFATLLDDHVPPDNRFCPYEYEDDEYKHCQAYVYAPFARSAEGLVLFDERAPELIRYGRCYRLHGGTHRFRAGSYSGYGLGRDQVRAAAAGMVDEGEEPPFYLWTFFADNEGWIGPKAAEILAGDFDQYGARLRSAMGARLRSAMGEGWDAWLDDWEKAFKLAAGTGVVVFA